MSTLEELRTLIQEKFGVDPALLDADQSLQASGLDSLALVEYLFAIEDHFGVSLPDMQGDVDTLAKLAELVDRLKAAKADAPMTA
jgi:acyl carrier protein